MFYLNSALLATLVREKRGDKSLRDLSDLIGNVSPSTLSRVENGSVPDMETFITLCNWLEVTPGHLFVAEQLETEKPDTLDEITNLLLSDKRLDRENAYILSRIVRAAYRELSKQ